MALGETLQAHTLDDSVIFLEDGQQAFNKVSPPPGKNITKFKKKIIEVTRVF